FAFSSVLRRDLLFFPTRRSSDLSPSREFILNLSINSFTFSSDFWIFRLVGLCSSLFGVTFRFNLISRFASNSTKYTSPPSDSNRSEEHTSELQSRENLVCRLLLE